MKQTCEFCGQPAQIIWQWLDGYPTKMKDNWLYTSEPVHTACKICWQWVKYTTQQNETERSNTK